MNRELYKEIILDLYRNPLHRGTVAHADATATTHNPSCGDEVTVTLALDGDTIVDAKHDGTGCAISIAATSLLLDDSIGKKVADVQDMRIQDVEALLGLQLDIMRKKCAGLGLQAVQAAIRNNS